MTQSKSFFGKLAFWKKDKEAKVNNGNGGMKQFLSRVSGAFMLPISVMAIAGLFLGVGAAIASNAGDNESLERFGNFIKNMGDPVFGAMPILFAMAIVVAFSDESGTAVFAAVIGMLVFAALQSVFIDSVDTYTPVSGTTAAGTIVDNNGVLSYENHVGYKILFTEGGRSAEDMEHLVGSTAGIQSLNTSVFGGIAVGAVVAYLYNRFHTIKLPTMISFFGGKRFVPLVVIVAMIPMAFAFLLLWPWIGKGLSEFGQATGEVPYGFESFIFGFAERALVPFGLHHVFYASLWWTNAGGDAQKELLEFVSTAQSTDAAVQSGATGTHLIDAADWDAIWSDMQAHGDKWYGDSFTWLSVNGLPINDVHWTDAAGDAHSANVFTFFQDELDLKLGRYMQGKFPFMIFGLPAAAAAMVFAAPKENRKMVMGTVLPAALTSFVTGVTEPIEFTFLFLAPLLFWGFHAFMAALSFMAMNLAGAHVGMTFSGGFLDLVVYGMIPVQKGTEFWWAIVIGLPLIPIYFTVFYFWIIKADLDTPGRGSNTKLFSKADFRNKKASAKGGLDPQGAAIVKAYGGWDNIVGFTNCATRLRYDVKDASIVDQDALKAAGAAGVVVVSDTHVQAIIGPSVSSVNANITANKGADIDAILGTSSEEVSSNEEVAAVETVSVSVLSVAEGNTDTLASIGDGVFSEKMMGDGIVVRFPEGIESADVHSPVSGELVTVFPTKHAYGIRTEEGVEVLVHIGVDTVNLDGKGFEAHVEQGQTVEAGAKLATVQVAEVREAAPSADPIVLVTSGQELENVAEGSVSLTDTLFTTK